MKTAAGTTKTLRLLLALPQVLLSSSCEQLLIALSKFIFALRDQRLDVDALRGPALVGGRELVAIGIRRIGTDIERRLAHQAGLPQPLGAHLADGLRSVLGQDPRRTSLGSNRGPAAGEPRSVSQTRTDTLAIR